MLGLGSWLQLSLASALRTLGRLDLGPLVGSCVYGLRLIRFRVRVRVKVLGLGLGLGLALALLVVLLIRERLALAPVVGVYACVCLCVYARVCVRTLAFSTCLRPRFWPR